MVCCMWGSSCYVVGCLEAPSVRVTPHSVGRCRVATEGSGRVSGPAERVGRESTDCIRSFGPGKALSVSFADSAPPLALRATSPVSGESVSQREPLDKFLSIPSKPILYPVRRKISTDLARFYKSDTNQPCHGTRPGQPVPGGQRQGLAADITDEATAAHP